MFPNDWEGSGGPKGSLDGRTRCSLGFIAVSGCDCERAQNQSPHGFLLALRRRNRGNAHAWWRFQTRQPGHWRSRNLCWPTSKRGSAVAL